MKSLSKLKKYYDYDDAECIGMRDVGNLFNQSTAEDYYKPIKAKSAFNGNYIEYESNERQRWKFIGKRIS